MTLFLAEMTALDVREGGFDKAALAIGATEFHGDHLPYGADTIAAETFARRFAADLGGMLLLPPLPYGVSPHHLAFPWTLSLRPETLTAIVVDVAESLLRHGIRKLLVVAAHDGNPGPIEIACRTLHDRHGLSVALFSGWQGQARALLAPHGRAIDLDHAGKSETSLVLYARPDLVRLDRAVDQPDQTTDLPVRLFGSFAQVAPHGYTGAASGGSAAEGEAIVDALADAVVPFLRKLDANDWRPGPWLDG